MRRTFSPVFGTHATVGNALERSCAGYKTAEDSYRKDLVWQQEAALSSESTEAPRNASEKTGKTKIPPVLFSAANDVRSARFRRHSFSLPSNTLHSSTRAIVLPTRTLACLCKSSPPSLFSTDLARRTGGD